MPKTTRTPATTTEATDAIDTAPVPATDNSAATITSALTLAPAGLTLRQLATQTGLGQNVVTAALQTLTEAGAVASTPGPTNGNRRSADVWTLLAPTVTDDTTTTDTAIEDTAVEDGAIEDGVPAADEPTTVEPTIADTAIGDHDKTTEDVPADHDADAPVSGAPVSGAPVSGAPAGTPDLRIIMVAGVLGDHPDGVSAADISNESGLRAQVVVRALAAMQAADAARLLPATDESTVELWVRGETDPATVDMANVALFTECPTCGHKTRLRTATGARRTGPGAPGINGDGQAKLAKGELRQLVLDFINRHPGHDLTAGTIARELGRSPGAVSNNFDHLIREGLVSAVDPDGRTVTALTTPAASADSAA